MTWIYPPPPPRMDAIVANEGLGTGIPYQSNNPGDWHFGWRVNPNYNHFETLSIYMCPWCIRNRSPGINQLLLCWCGLEVMKYMSHLGSQWWRWKKTSAKKTNKSPHLHWSSPKYDVVTFVKGTETHKNIFPAFPLISGQTCSAFHLFPCISHKKGSETKDINMSVFPILPFRVTLHPPQLGKSHHSERSPGLGRCTVFSPPSPGSEVGKLPKITS